MSLLSVIATADEDFVFGNQCLQKLADRRAKLSIDMGDDLWPELTACWNALQFPETIHAGVDLLDALVHQEFRNTGGRESRQRDLLLSLRGLAHLRRDLQNDASKLLAKTSSWQSVSWPNAKSSVRQTAQPVWAELPDGVIKHYSGAEPAYLYYKQPLVGDFTVEFEVARDGRPSPQILYADLWLGLDAAMTSYSHGRIGFPMTSIELAEPVTIEGSYRFQMQVKDGVCTYWVNDIMVEEEMLPPYPDPWLAIRCDVSADNDTIKGLKVSGVPTVPAKVEISRLTNLHGWTSGHFGQSMRYAGADWLRAGQFFMGANRKNQRASRRESLLQYHRPMLEDGQIEFSFEYSKTQLVHPAIGRTAFLLTENGVQEHTITNGIHGHQGLYPENKQVLPSNQLQKELNFQAGKNRMVVAVKGDTVTLNLNGTDVYRKQLVSNETRVFGFFHYPGETGAVVSDVVYKGDWTVVVP